MRQPFGGPKERAQAGFQKVDKEKRATLLRMFGFVFRHYGWAIAVEIICRSESTSLVYTLMMSPCDRWSK